MWRNTAREAKLFALDAKAAVTFFLILIFPSMITLYIVLGILAFFAFINYKGFNVSQFLRYVKAFFAGNRRVTPYDSLRRKYND